MHEDTDYVLIFDGGSQGNPGRAYGSYLLRTRDRRERLERLEFGTGTNNEAEYQSLIAGLESLLERIEQARADPARFTLEVRGDSQLVLRQVGGQWKLRDPRMAEYARRAQALLQRFGHYRLVEQPRAESVKVLGH